MHGMRGSGYYVLRSYTRNDYYTVLQRHRFREGWNKTNAVLPALSFHLMPASEIHQRYITTPFDDLSQPFWCKRRAIVVQGKMQPVAHRPRAKRGVTGEKKKVVEEETNKKVEILLKHNQGL